jgi:sulfur carrier protein
MHIILPDKTVRTCSGELATVEQLLLDLGINPLEVMVIRNGKLLPETASVREDDEIRIIMVSHGG